MARIRSVHPGLFTDEAFMTLTVERPICVALLIGLWSDSDDSGVFEWKSLTLKARLLPAVADDVGELLNVLAKLKFIKRFEVRGKSYGVIRNFVRFQRPKKPSDIHPATKEMLSYAGFEAGGKRPSAGTGRRSSEDNPEPVTNSAGTSSELVENQTETGSQIRAQMEEEGGRREEEEESLPSSVSDPASIAPVGLRAKCLNLVGVEPCKLAQDFYKLQDVAKAEDWHEADILEGIATALRRGTRKFNHWMSFEEWIRNSAKARLGRIPRAAVHSAAAPGEKTINLECVGVIPEANVIKRIREPSADWERHFFGDRNGFRGAVKSAAPHLLALFDEALAPQPPALESETR